MILMIRAWLEWAEYISIFFTVMALIFSFASNSSSWFFLGVTLTLILNLISRWRSENRTKSRIGATLNIQLRRFSAEVEELKTRLELYINHQKKIVLPPKIVSNTPKSEDKIIASLQEDLESLHKSLVSTIDYLKETKLEVRIKTLETLYESWQSSRKNIPPLESKIKLPDQNILDQSQDFNLQPPTKIAWKCIHLINAHNESVTDIAITYDNKYLLSTSWDKYLKLWSLAEGNEINGTIASEQGVVSLAVSNDDYLDGGIVTGSLDQDVKIWSLELAKDTSLSFALKHNLKEHNGSIHGLEIASDKKIVVSGSYDQSIKQWDLSTGHLLYSSLSENSGINAIALNEPCGFIVTGGGDGILTIWELESEKKLGLLIGNVNSLKSLAISESGEFIAGGCADGSIKIWQLPTTTFSVFLEIEPCLELQGHHGQVMDLFFTSDGQLLYSGGIDGLIRIWHPATAQELGHLKISDDDRIFSLALSLDEQILAAGGVNGNIKIWQQSQIIDN